MRKLPWYRKDKGLLYFAYRNLIPPETLVLWFLTEPDCSGKRTAWVAGREFPIGHVGEGRFPPLEWCSTGTSPERLRSLHTCTYSELDGMGSLTSHHNWSYLEQEVGPGTSRGPCHLNPSVMLHHLCSIQSILYVLILFERSKKEMYVTKNFPDKERTRSRTEK